MKKVLFLMALAGASLTASAQTGSYVPKHEFGVNLFGGISSLQYSIDYTDHKLGMGGGFGFSYIYHFNDQWGLLTGLQGAYYQGKVTTDQWWTNYQVADYQNAVNARSLVYMDFEEKQSAMHLQVPIMVQNMIPMGKHHFYWAAGLKLGFKLTDNYKQSGELAESEANFYKYTWEINTHTRASGNPGQVASSDLFDRTYSFNNGKHLLGQDGGVMEPDPTDVIDQDEDLDMKSFNLMASGEIGVRWALSDKMGLYTGIYLDYGILNCRPELAIDKYKDNSNGVWEKVPFLPGITPSPREWGAVPMSILQAEKSDYIGATPSRFGDDLMDPEVVRTKGAVADRLSTLGFGINLRLTFGAAEPAPKPVIIKPVTPPDPVDIPVDINAKMRELSNTLFAFDKFDLNDKAKGYLDEIAEWLNENPNLNVEIAGHTDSKGSDEYNQRLSENRAKSVYEYFISKGVKASRLSYKGYGESMPIATNETDEGRQLNRRVELKVIK